MAQRDNALGTPALLQAFSCALDSVIAPAEAPALVRLLSQSASTRAARPSWARTRGAASGPSSAKRAQCACRPKRSNGWREAAPTTRPATPPPAGWRDACWPRWHPIAPREILERARMFGESRVVCGVHHVTAVEAGRTHRRRRARGAARRAGLPRPTWTGARGGVAAARQGEAVGRRLRRRRGRAVRTAVLDPCQNVRGGRLLAGPLGRLKAAPTSTTRAARRGRRRSRRSRDAAAASPPDCHAAARSAPTRRARGPGTTACR